MLTNHELHYPLEHFLKWLQLKPDPSCPGFPRAASSWVDHEKRKIFFTLETA
ncbi:hypothetical protein M422DRAFT_269075 [Sphaerobolus stellatus SS14]|uniref:Uncharacterized protein n=1 Tax=Sphaerobolus stellatus (strain SS14) TaxID=990650 RepID=A0A0C9U5I5_SPHS4|nr:hypothetical protein M422DRAFT_269075 [Sphaerobolus stellatus SS14]